MLNKSQTNHGGDDGIILASLTESINADTIGTPDQRRFDASVKSVGTPTDMHSCDSCVGSVDVTADLHSFDATVQSVGTPTVESVDVSTDLHSNDATDEPVGIPADLRISDPTVESFVLPSLNLSSEILRESSDLPISDVSNSPNVDVSRGETSGLISDVSVDKLVIYNFPKSLNNLVLILFLAA